MGFYLTFVLVILHQIYNQRYRQEDKYRLTVYEKRHITIPCLVNQILSVFQILCYIQRAHAGWSAWVKLS